MSTKNKKSVASQALLEMDAITSAIKEESKNTLNTLLSEAVRNALRESCEEEEDKEYDIEEEDADNNEENSEEGAKSDVAEDGNPEMEPEIPQGRYLSGCRPRRCAYPRTAAHVLLSLYAPADHRRARVYRYATSLPH